MRRMHFDVQPIDTSSAQQSRKRTLDDSNNVASKKSRGDNDGDCCYCKICGLHALKKSIISPKDSVKGRKCPP